jgi:hypothetical protein
MKNSKILSSLKRILDYPFLLLYCLALQKAITKFFNVFIFSMLQNIRVQKIIALSLQIYCKPIAFAIAKKQNNICENPCPNDGVGRMRETFTSSSHILNPANSAGQAGYPLLLCVLSELLHHNTKAQQARHP